MLGRAFRFVYQSERFALGALLALCAGVLWYVSEAATSPLGAWKVVMLNAILILAVHAARRDTQLLRSAGIDPRVAGAAEYLALSVPILVVLGVKSQFAHAALLATSAMCVALLPTASSKRKRTRPRIPPLAPSVAFEWIAGLRSSVVWFTGLLAMAIVFSEFPIAILGAIVIQTWITCGFYGEGEGWQMIRAVGGRPNEFLRRKLAIGLRQWAIVNAPLMLLFIGTRTDLVWVLMAVVALCMITLAMSIVAKYAMYKPHRMPGGLSGVMPMIFTGFALAFPVLIYAAHRMWHSAIDNLETYL